MGIRKQKKMIFHGRPAAPLTIIRHAKIMLSTLKLLSLSLRSQGSSTTTGVHGVPAPGSSHLTVVLHAPRRRDRRCAAAGRRQPMPLGDRRRRAVAGRRWSAPLGGGRRSSAAGGGVRRRDGGGPRQIWRCDGIGGQRIHLSPSLPLCDLFEIRSCSCKSSFVAMRIGVRFCVALVHLLMWNMFIICLLFMWELIG